MNKKGLAARQSTFNMGKLYSRVMSVVMVGKNKLLTGVNMDIFILNQSST
jgi:hypothetical protein